MSNTTREVYVLAGFNGLDGKTHKRGEVLTVAYETPQQRREVNTLVYRGFLTLDVASAQKHADEPKKKTTTSGKGRKSSS